MRYRLMPAPMMAMSSFRLLSRASSTSTPKSSANGHIQ